MAEQDRPDEKLREEPQETAGPKDKPVGFIEKLAQRSAGLPTPPTDADQKPAQEKSSWAFAGAGLQFAVTTGVFAFIGWYLDKRFGWAPWGVVGLTMVGFIGGLYLLIKEALKQNETPPPGAAPPGAPGKKK